MWKQFTHPEYALSLSKPFIGLLRWCTGKESACQCRCRKCRFDPWVRKISWRRNGNPLQYFCLENSMDRGAWWVTIPGVTQSDTTEQLSTHTPPTRRIIAIMWFNLTPSSVGSFSTCNEQRENWGQRSLVTYLRSHSWCTSELRFKFQTLIPEPFQLGNPLCSFLFRITSSVDG